MRGIVVLTVLAWTLVGCSGRDAAHYLAVLDEFSAPEGWVDARTVVHAPGGDVECQPTPISECPYVVRFYRTASTAMEAYQAALTAVDAAGFALEREFDPACDDQSPACALTATRDADRLSVTVFHRGTDDGTGVAQEDRVAIRVVAEDS